MRLVSSLPLPFSSWVIITAYWPGGRSLKAKVASAPRAGAPSACTGAALPSQPSREATTATCTTPVCARMPCSFTVSSAAAAGAVTASAAASARARETMLRLMVVRLMVVKFMGLPSAPEWRGQSLPTPARGQMPAVTDPQCRKSLSGARALPSPGPAASMPHARIPQKPAAAAEPGGILHHCRGGPVTALHRTRSDGACRAVPGCLRCLLHRAEHHCQTPQTPVLGVAGADGWRGAGADPPARSWAPRRSCW